MYIRQGWLEASQKCKQMQFHCQKDEEEMEPGCKQASSAERNREKRAKGFLWDVEGGSGAQKSWICYAMPATA